MNWSKKNKILLAVLLLGIVGVWGGIQIIYKPHTAIEDQKALFKGAAADFKMEMNNPQNWHNAILELSGSISDLGEESLMLNETIYCQLKDVVVLKSLLLGQTIQLKGRFIGYDDLLEEIKLDQCILLSKK